MTKTWNMTKMVANQVTMSFEWVKAHVWIIGNEKAYNLVKRLRKKAEFQEAPYSYARGYVVSRNGDLLTKVVEFCL